MLYQLIWLSQFTSDFAVYCDRDDDRTSRREYIPASERWMWAMAVLVNYLDASLSLAIVFLLVILAVIGLAMLWAVVVN